MPVRRAAPRYKTALERKLPACLIQSVAGERLDAATGALREFGIRELTSARADDRVMLWQKAFVGQVVKRREQLAASQVAGRAENYQRLGWRRCKCHGAWP